MAFNGLKIRWVNLCVNRLYAGTKQKHFEKKRRLLNWAGHKIGEGTKIAGPLFCTGTLVTGKDCWIGRGMIIDGNGTVTIGDNCNIAPEAAFQTGGHEIGGGERRAGSGFNRDIEVANGCWIGARSTVLGGVRIGSGCVVAACACVNKNVDADSVVGGVPAKTIRKL